MKIPITIPDCLRDKLVLLRESQLQRYGSDELRSVDGVHLWGTIGADVYLTFDGRFILSEDSVSRGQSIGETHRLDCIGLGLATAAFAHNLPELLDYLPPRPKDEEPCRYCQGTRRVVFPTGHPREQTCPACCGFGWGNQMSS
jgi:hypothetical protein